jgi:hypothetical protein
VKIDLGNVDPGTNWGLRDAFVVRWTRWGPRAQKWPRPGAFKNAAGQAWWRGLFGKAGYMASNPNPIDAAAAEVAARHTQQVPRDQLTSAMYGNLIEIVGPDGITWPVTDKSEPAPPPPPDPPGDDEMWNWFLWDDAWDGNANTSSNAAKGQYFAPEQDMLIKGVRAIIIGVTGVTYRCTLAETTSTGTITNVISTGDYVAVASFKRLMDFPVAGPVTAGNYFVLLFSTPFSSNTAPFPIAFQTNFAPLFPATDWGRVTLARAVPAIGDTCSFTSVGAVPCGFRT